MLHNIHLLKRYSYFATIHIFEATTRSIIVSQFVVYLHDLVDDDLFKLMGHPVYFIKVLHMRPCFKFVYLFSFYLILGR